MKKSILVLGLLTFAVSVSSFNSIVNVNKTVVNPNEMLREGRITSVQGNQVLIEDKATGEGFEFNKNGAFHEILIGDDVIFITITTPNGKKIVKQVMKKN